MKSCFPLFKLWSVCVLALLATAACAGFALDVEWP
jgi:hypothetical protein